MNGKRIWNCIYNKNYIPGRRQGPLHRVSMPILIDAPR